MPLVDYASSDDEADIAAEDIAKSKQSPPKSLLRKHVELPPLPETFLDLYASTVRTSSVDDPALHGGRKRTTPHVQGNWPTHVYIEWLPNGEVFNILQTLIKDIQEADPSIPITSHLTSDVGTTLPLHISLSRPIGFMADIKDAFLVALKSKMPTCDVPPFELRFNGLDWVSNFEGSRWFLVLRLERPEGDGLNKLLTACNDVVQQYGQPPLYAQQKAVSSGPHHDRDVERARSTPMPESSTKTTDVSNAFHISIAWTIAHPSPLLQDAVSSYATSPSFRTLQHHTVNVQSVKAKIGNVVTSLPLPAAGRAKHRTLFGS